MVNFSRNKYIKSKMDGYEGKVFAVSLKIILIGKSLK